MRRPLRRVARHPGARHRQPHSARACVAAGVGPARCAAGALGRRTEFLRMKRFVWLSLLFLAAALAGFDAWRAQRAHALTGERHTRGESAEAIARALTQDLVSIERHGEQVTLVSGGRFGRADGSRSADWRAPIRFTLSRGDEFQRAPDHHFSWQFRIEEIGARGVRLAYVHRYAHPVANGRGSDTGELWLDYRAAPVP
jgi:hypothetical protein